MKHKGIRAIDQRSQLALWIKKQRRELFADLGGEESLSSQQRKLVEDVIKRLVMIETLDNWIFRQPSIINGRTRSLHPLVLQRMSIADGMVRCLEKLGLEKKAKAISLADYLNNQPGGQP